VFCAITILGTRRKVKEGHNLEDQGVDGEILLIHILNYMEGLKFVHTVQHTDQ
jgi:hypothetical protein